jgi:hypothetical protein
MGSWIRRFISRFKSIPRNYLQISAANGPDKSRDKNLDINIARDAIQRSASFPGCGMQQQAVIPLNVASKCSGFNNTVAYNRINFTTGICPGFENNYRSLRYCIKYSIKYSAVHRERIALIVQVNRPLELT